MTRLVLKLLGGFEAALDGEPVSGFGYDKVRALLAYLAVESDRVHRREYLAGLLWSAYPEHAARVNLRHTLMELRNAIGDRKASPPFLNITRNTIRFNHKGGYQLDTEVVEKTHAHLKEASVDTLIEAVDFYSGDFLAGFSLADAADFDNWASVTREQLRQQTLDLLGAVVDRLAPDNPEGALPYARRRVDMEPWLEDAQRQLIRTLAASGRRSEALRQYRRCVRILEHELGAEPAAETAELYAEIRSAGAAPKRWVKSRIPRARMSVPPAFLDPTAEPAVSERTVFVGRESALTRLGGYLRTALSGQGQMAFIVGGPGRGKTALMRAFARRAMAAYPDLLVLSGACNATSGVGDPYLPFREVLAMLTGNIETYWQAGTVSREHAQRLWRALPITLSALVQHGPYIIGTLVRSSELLLRAERAGLSESDWMRDLKMLANRIPVSTVQQQALFQQITNALQAVSAPHPLILLLDDLQWADRGSIGLLFHLGRRLQGSRILVLGAYRPEEIATGHAPGEGAEPHPLHPLLNEFRRDFGDVWIDLREADAIEGETFVHSLIDTENNRLGKDFRMRLYQRTGGHPLFTIELLRAMQTRGDLHKGPDDAWVEGGSLDWFRLPARIEAVIEERLSRLPPKHRDLLAVASVEGETFTHQVLSEIQALPERTVLQMLTRDLRDHHRLVVERAETPVAGRFLTQFAFSHRLYREHLYRRMSHGERRLLHREVGAVLEELYTEGNDRIAPQLAHHFYQAGHTAKAITYAARAGEQARTAYAYDEARRYFERARRLAKNTQLNEATERAHLTALSGMGKMGIVTGDLPEAERCLRSAVTLGRQLAVDRQEIAVMMYWLGEALWWQGKYEEEARLGEEGLSLVEQDSRSLGAALMNQTLAAVDAVTGQWARARELTRQTAGFIDDLPYVEELRSAYTHIVMMCTMTKNIKGVRHWLEVWGQRARSHGDLLAVGTAHYDAARLMGNIGNVEEAVARTLLAKSTSIRTGDIRQESWAWRELAFRYLASGNLQEAKRCIRRERELTSTIGYTRDIASSHSLIGRIAFCEGDQNAAIAAFEQAESLYASVNNQAGLARARCLLGRAYLAAKDRYQAEAYFQEGLLSLAGIESDPTVRWEIIPLLIPLLSGLEAAMKDGRMLRDWVQRYREQNPHLSSILVQWSLAPIKGDVRKENPLRIAGLPPSEPDWRWHDPFEDCSYKLEDGLEIRAASPRYLWGLNVSAPRWLHPWPQGVTRATIQVTCEPAKDDRPAMGGLLLWKDKATYLWVEVGRFGPRDIAFGGCLDDHDRIIGRGRLPARDGSGWQSNEPIGLSLQISSNRVVAYCRTDGGTCYVVGKTFFPLDESVQVGVHAIGPAGRIDRITGMIDQIVYPGTCPKGTAIRFRMFRVWGE